MTIYNNVIDLIGKTPLVELQNIEKEYHLEAKLVAKVEFFNPAGSAKDRVDQVCGYGSLQRFGRGPEFADKDQ